MNWPKCDWSTNIDKEGINTTYGITNTIQMHIISMGHINLVILGLVSLIYLKPRVKTVISKQNPPKILYISGRVCVI